MKEKYLLYATGCRLQAKGIRYKMGSMKRRSSFTLIEIMLVVIIIGILATVVMPRLVGRSEEARIAAAKADIANIGLALDLYEMDIGHFPNENEGGLKALQEKPASLSAELADKWKGPYLKKEPKDPWKRPYEYTPGDREYRLCSKGPDETNSEDDICNGGEN